MQLINCKLYTPVNKTRGDSAYLIDEGGQDWYESQQNFSKKWKLGINTEDGTIQMMNTDVTMMWPCGLSLVEVDEIPEGTNIQGGWYFDGNEVLPKATTV